MNIRRDLSEAFQMNDEDLGQRPESEGLDGPLL